mmetsp:Transcript_22382/g.73519  ORF Transcript_22382/g.73519 Transcript_22382/m.73519 type:complete len:109 (+) Transcript_22382:486-812(+)
MVGNGATRFLVTTGQGLIWGAIEKPWELLLDKTRKNVARKRMGCISSLEHNIVLDRPRAFEVHCWGDSRQAPGGNPGRHLESREIGFQAQIHFFAPARRSLGHLHARL